MVSRRSYVPQRCRIGEHEMAYVRAGKGPQPVLLIHGITSSSFIWDPVIPYLESECDVVAIDLLGCGDSDRRLPADYSLKAHASRLPHILEHLGWDRFHLAGHDLGGGIAQIFAVGCSLCLKSLSLANTVGFDYWPVQPIIAMRTPIIRQLAMATLDAGMLRLIIRRGVYHKERVTSELLARFHEEVAAPDVRKAFLNFARCLNNGDLMEIADRLPGLKVPTLVIRGDADVYLSAQIATRLNRELPMNRLVRLPTAGHFIQLDEPELLAEHLLGHIRKCADG